VEEPAQRKDEIDGEPGEDDKEPDDGDDELHEERNDEVEEVN